MGENKNACTLLSGKSEGKRPLASPRHRWAQEKNKWQAPVNKVFNLCGPKNADNFLTTYANNSFSRKTELVGCQLLISYLVVVYLFIHSFIHFFMYSFIYLASQLDRLSQPPR